MAPREFHLIDLSIPVDLHGQPFAQGVHHRCAHAVQSAGYLIAPAAEFSAGVEHGIHHFQSGLARLGLNIHRNAPAVVHHRDGIIRVDLHQDIRTIAGKRLVNGVVHNFIDQMMKSAK